MSSFEMLNIFVLFLAGGAFMLTGMFIFRKFEDDLEEKSLGALLFLIGIPFLMMGVRAFLLSLDIIGERAAYYFYLVHLFIPPI